MKARIPFKTALLSRTNKPVAYISQKKGRGTLTLTIEVDLDTDVIEILNDNEDADAVTKANSRESIIGQALMQTSAHVTDAKITVDDPALGPCNFSLKGLIQTKVPGTGGFVSSRSKKLKNVSKKSR